MSMEEPGDAAVERAHRMVEENLILNSTPEADRVRRTLEDAVRQQDHEAIRSEGHLWSGFLGRLILSLADVVEDAEVKG